MKRLGFSLGLLRLEQRNELRKFQELSEISEIILQDMFALSYSPLCCNIQKTNQNGQCTSCSFAPIQRSLVSNNQFIVKM